MVVKSPCVPQLGFETGVKPEGEKKRRNKLNFQASVFFD